MSHNKSKIPLTSINPNIAKNLLRNKKRFKNDGVIQTDDIINIHDIKQPTITVGKINTTIPLQENNMNNTQEKEQMPQPKLPEMAEQIILNNEPTIEPDITSINEPLIEEGVQTLEG